MRRVLLTPDLRGTRVLSHFQAKLVKQEQQAIDAQYEKKRKGAEVAQKMCVPPLASYFPSPTMLIEYRYAVRNLL